MPIRLLGFLRMAHASGWGTRCRRLPGGADDDLNAELENAPDGPADVVDAARRPRSLPDPARPRPTAPS